MMTYAQFNAIDIIDNFELIHHIKKTPYNTIHTYSAFILADGEEIITDISRGTFLTLKEEYCYTLVDEFISQGDGYGCWDIDRFFW